MNLYMQCAFVIVSIDTYPWWLFICILKQSIYILHPLWQNYELPLSLLILWHFSYIEITGYQSCYNANITLVQGSLTGKSTVIASLTNVLILIGCWFTLSITVCFYSSHWRDFATATQGDVTMRAISSCVGGDSSTTGNCLLSSVIGICCLVTLWIVDFGLTFLNCCFQI